MNTKLRLISALKSRPKLRAIWTVEHEQELVAMYQVGAMRRITRLLARQKVLLERIASVQINKRYYKKVIIRGKPGRITRPSARHGKRQRNGVSKA